MKSRPFVASETPSAISVVDGPCRIEVKNLKYSSSGSKDSHRFEATVYVDGEPSFKTGNEGYGSVNYFFECKDQSKEDCLENVKAAGFIALDYYKNNLLKRFINALKNSDDDPYAPTEDVASALHVVVNHQINLSQSLARMRQSLQKRIIYFIPETKALLSVELRPTQDHIDECINQYGAASKTWLWLNHLSEDQAFKIWCLGEGVINDLISKENEMLRAEENNAYGQTGDALKKLRSENNGETSQ